MLTDFQISFTDTVSGKFAIYCSLRIPPHVKGVARLPREMLMSENYSKYNLLHHLFAQKMKLMNISNSQVIAINVVISIITSGVQNVHLRHHTSLMLNSLRTGLVLPLPCLRLVLIVPVLRSLAKRLHHPNLFYPFSRKLT